MDYKTLSATRSTPAIGAEITGLDLTHELTDEEEKELKQAFTEHQVIFFRGQPILEPAQQIRLARLFGELHQHPAAPIHPEHPGIFVIHAHEGSKVVNGNCWHSDVSCDLEPPLGTILQLHLLPPSGGDTVFASTYAAYDALSDTMKSLLRGLIAIHESEHFYRGRYTGRGVDDAGTVYPSAEHPMVRTHPVSGNRRSISIARSRRRSKA